MNAGRITRSVLGVVAVVGLVAGCGSASTGSSSTGTTANADFASLAPGVQALEQRPTSIKTTDAIKGPIPAGRTIAFIQCGAPICRSIGEDLTAAAAQLHWKVDAINAGLTAETIKAAWDQAVNSHPDAVVTSGTPRTLFNSALAELAASNTPVIDLTTNDSAGDGITQVFGGPADYARQGTNIADYMLVNSGSAPVHELSVSVSAYPTVGLTAGGVSGELRKRCPTCTADLLDVPASSIGSDLPTRVTSYLSAHPDVNWLYVGFADMVTGLPAALQGAGLGNVKIVTLSTNPTVATYLQSGRNVVMATGFDLTELPWRSVDFLARTWTGSPTTQNTDPANLPTWFVTGANLPSASENFPYVADYQSQYKKLWGLG